MHQMEHESVSVYMYKWGRALYRSSGIRPDEERHPHVIKDFISSLKKNIRNKIANRWAEMQHPPSTVERAFELACDVEKQLQVTDSFKLDCPTYPSRELNEMSAEDSSGDENEVNEIARNKRWVSNPGSYNCKQPNTHNNAILITMVAIVITDFNNDHMRPNNRNNGHKNKRILKSH